MNKEDILKFKLGTHVLVTSNDELHRHTGTVDGKPTLWNINGNKVSCPHGYKPMWFIRVLLDSPIKDKRGRFQSAAGICLHNLKIIASHKIEKVIDINEQRSKNGTSGENPEAKTDNLWDGWPDGKPPF